MEYTRSELIRRLSDIPRKGWTDHQIRDLIDSLWRDPFFNRTSGFDTPGDFDSDIAFDNETRTFSITPKAYSFNFWQFIRKIAFFKRTEPMEVIIPDEEGFYLIYIARDEEDPKKPQKLFALHNPTYEQEQEVYLLKTIVSWIYWDAANSQAIYFGEERHGSEWPPQVHWFIHSAIGMKAISGFVIDSFATGDTKFNITGGTALHEDILHEFDGISDGTIPILLFVDNNPRITINPGYSVFGPFWNFPINGIGGAEPADGGEHILYHIFATNCKLAPFVAQMGLNKYDDLQDAVYAANYEVKQLESMRLHKSRVLLYTVIYKVDGNAPNGMSLVRATPQHAAINWISNNYSEISSYITVQNALPYLKTGWPPNPLNYMTIVGVGGDVKIRPNGLLIPMYIQGVKINIRGELDFPIDINIHGMQYQTNNLSQINARSATRWDNGQNTDVFCFAQFYNKTKGKFLYHGLELHNWAMEPTSRGFMHETLFTEYVEGLAISIANNGIVVESGKIKDEDFVLFIGQKSPLQCPKYFLYVDGTEGLTWDSYDNLTIPVILERDNHISFHDPANPGQMLSTETGDWTCMWVLATMCGQYPIKLIPGTGKGSTKEESEEKNPVTELKQLIDASNFFCEEYIVLGRVPVQDTGETPFFTLTGVTDFKDIDLEKLGEDIYVEDGEFDEVSSELVLHRTQKMPPIRIVIPTPEVPDPFVTPESTEVKNGPLYNQYVVDDVRNIAPAGWHVPTEAEIDTLIAKLNESDVVDSQVTGEEYWESGNGTNTTGFSAKGAGYRDATGAFSSIKQLLAFWATTNKLIFVLEDSSSIYKTADEDSKLLGASIRLIKDDSTDPGTMTCNSGIEYPTIKLGNQVWMAENLASKKYRNGDDIPVANDNSAWAALSTHAMCYYDNDEDNSFISIPETTFSGNFIELLDTPKSYSGKAGKMVVVKDSENGLQFKDFTYENLHDKPSVFQSDYNNLINKPVSFPPSSHAHKHNDTTEKQGGVPALNQFYHVGKDVFQKLKALYTDIINDGALFQKKNTYGFYYNWEAVNDSRNIAPAGWRVPTVQDFQTLIDFYGANGNYTTNNLGYAVGAGSPFNSIGAGFRTTDGFWPRNQQSGLWTSERTSRTGQVYENDGLWNNTGLAEWVVNSLSGSMHCPGALWWENHSIHVSTGLSIRLIKEDSTDPGEMIGNDKQKYKTVKIGNQVWTAEHLLETKYRNGDLITAIENSGFTTAGSGARCSFEYDENNCYDGFVAVPPPTMEDIDMPNVSLLFENQLI